MSISSVLFYFFVSFVWLILILFIYKNTEYFKINIHTLNIHVFVDKHIFLVNIHILFLIFIFSSINVYLIVSISYGTLMSHVTLMFTINSCIDLEQTQL